MEQKKQNQNNKRRPKVKSFVFGVNQIATGEADMLVNDFSETHKVTVIQFERDKHLFIYRILFFE